MFEDWDMLIKSHQYSRKEFKNGVWRYYYDKNNNFSRMTRCKSTPLKINASMSASAIVSAASDYIQNVWLADWKTHPDLAICKELKGKTISFESISYKHLSTAGKHSNGHSKVRDVPNLIDHVRYLPLAKELLENNGVHTQSRYEEFSAPKKDGSIGLVYQTVSGLAPKGDKNNYVQVTVSQKKYADGKLSNTVYISVVGTKDIKKSLLNKSKDSDDFSARLVVDTKTVPTAKNNIPHKRRAVNKSIRFEFENITPTNKYEKMEKAVRCLSKALRVPIGIEKSEKRGEGFVFKAQEDLTTKWDKFFDDYTKSVYEFVTSYFGLPKAENTTVKKAISDDVLTHKGKVLYECESGKPIKKADWDKFVKNLEKFMNKNLKDSEKKIILNSTALSKVLNRMLQYNTFDAVKQLPLMDLNYNDKSFDWISDSVKNMQNAFGNSFSRQEQARIEIMQQSAGLKITNIDNKMRSDIQTILVDGVKNHKSKSDVAQMLFDKMTGDNRDFKRLADTEMQNAFNNGFVREEVYNTPEGEKTYFQRVEVIDDNTCPFCRRMNGKIALWSDKPLSSQNADDGIADFVIWEGKEWSGEKDDVCTGAFHPWCRGAWLRYYPNEE